MWVKCKLQKLNKSSKSKADRFLIVSLGAIGTRHLQNLRILRPNSEIGVLRLSAYKADELPLGVNAQFFNLDDAVAFSPLAVFICSPATLHLDIARIFVEHSIPTFIEKPFADKLFGLVELIKNAELKKTPLMIGYNLRFLPSLVKVRRLIHSGAIGNVLGIRAEVGQFLPDWRPGTCYKNSVSASKKLGGGVLLELSHEIDYVYWIFGMPTWVTATCAKYSGLNIDVEDMASICLEYGNPKRLASIHMDFIQRSASRSCKFIGESGTLIWDGVANTIDLYQAKSGKWLQTNMSENLDRNTMYLSELSHFLDCVEGNQKPTVDGQQGLDVLRIIEAAKKSATLRISVEP